MKYQINRETLCAPTINQIENILGYRFKDKKLLIQALTTREMDPANNYERAEFFGDKILDAVIIEILLHEYQDASEGALTGALNELTRQESMAALCLRLGLHKYVQHTDSNIPISTLCDIIESTVAAMYRDGGPEAVQDFVLRFFLPMLQDKECPREGARIVRAAASDAGGCIKYQWQDDGCALVVKKKKAVARSSTMERKVSTKKDPTRLAKYLAEREFITKKLDEKYQRCLVRLAIDPDYKPLDKAPVINLSWSVVLKKNFREGLHALMPMLGHNVPEYSFKNGDESTGARFICTLDNHIFKPITMHATTKRGAEEAVAEIAYKEIQKSVILTEILACESKVITVLDKKRPVCSLNSMCQLFGLEAPSYTSYIKEKNGAGTFYTRMSAPWLMTVIKGPSKLIVSEAKEGVAERVLSLMQRFSDGCIEPKKLQLLRELGSSGEPINILIRLCKLTDLEEPSIETHLCEGPVSDGRRYKAAITLDDKKWGNKSIVGCKDKSKKEAEKDAAKKALNYVANKMFKDEIALKIS